MCRSIKTLRPPYVEEPTPDDSLAAALQYVRKVAGMRKPSGANQAAFEEAVTTIAAATERLLANITVRTPATAPKA
jgi:hypothetical protein